MNALGDIFRNSGNALSCAWQVLRYLGSFIWLLLLPKAVLAARILALQSQLAVCKHRIDADKVRDLGIEPREILYGMLWSDGLARHCQKLGVQWDPNDVEASVRRVIKFYRK